MKLIEKTGDLFSTDARAIGHGVNIRGLMGHGIAVDFKNRFPDMHTKYQVLCHSGYLVPGAVYTYQVPGAQPPMFVYNIASQDEPGRNARLDWLEEGVRVALGHADKHGLDKIGLPRIAAGIGGLDIADVRAVLSKVAQEHTCDIELWTKP